LKKTKNKMNKELKKILVVRTDKIGDVVLSLPVVTALKQAFENVSVTMLINPLVKDIVEMCPDVDKILFDMEPGFGSLVSDLRREKFDAALLLHPTLRLAAALFFAGIPLRIGTGYRLYSFLFNKKVFEHRKTGNKHEAELNLSLARALYPDINPDNILFNLNIDSEIIKDAAGKSENSGVNFSSPFIVIHPGSKGSALTWSEDNFRALVKILSEKIGFQILVTGVEEEKDMAEKICGKNRNVFNTAGLFTLKELAAVLKKSELVIANSTGPIHIAAALNTFVVGFYPPARPMNAKRWGPYTKKRLLFVPETGEICSSCSGPECPYWNCMDLIDVRDVAEKVMSVLNNKGMA